MDNRPKIVLTGGGTAGHVIPNLALLPSLFAEGWEAEYIGSACGIEKRLVEAKGLPFHSIASGKLRRYFDLKNFTDPFRVLLGGLQAWSLLGRIKPNVVFSKGGFVAVPVVVAARLRGIPVIIHESDLTPGLANRLTIPCARIVCASFPETLKHLPAEKGVVTGAPIRIELFTGVREKGETFLRLPPSQDPAILKPLLLVMGGSLGSRILNQAVRLILPELLTRFRVAHICGQGGLDSTVEATPGYRQFEFISSEISDVLAASDFILSRAGSNAIFEFLSLQKPHLLVPLSRAASRGDQILNAEAFAAKGYSSVLPEENLGGGRLLKELDALRANGDQYVQAMRFSPIRNGTEQVMDQIRKFA